MMTMKLKLLQKCIYKGSHGKSNSYKSISMQFIKGLRYNKKKNQEIPILIVSVNTNIFRQMKNDPTNPVV